MKNQQRYSIVGDPRTIRLTKEQGHALKRPEGSEIEVHHLWFILPLKGGWRVAYRLFPREGRPVVAELRVYPYAGDLPGLKPGDWAVELLGFEAEVPGDGITASLLNEQVVLGQHVFEIFPRALRRTRDGVGSTPVRDRDGNVITLYDALLGGFGFDPGVKTRRRGPKGWSDLEYATLAQEYLDRLRASRSPVKDLAEARGMSEVGARAAVHRARNRGLLSRQKQGRAGGELTPRAKALLRQASGERKPKKR